MFIPAYDRDIGFDDLLDNIFIETALTENNNYTTVEEFTGEMSKVSVNMTFRVIMCQENFYGADCASFCLAQDDDENGHYTCNSDGSFQCRDGFENPINNCRDGRSDHDLILNMVPELHEEPLHEICYSITLYVCSTNTLSVVNPCDATPCANNGSCTAMGSFNYTCQCYTGSTCEDNIDGCLTITCPNNSVCVNGSMCVCPLGSDLVTEVCIQLTEATPTDQPGIDTCMEDMHCL